MYGAARERRQALGNIPEEEEQDPRDMYRFRESSELSSIWLPANPTSAFSQPRPSFTLLPRHHVYMKRLEGCYMAQRDGRQGES